MPPPDTSPGSDSAGGVVRGFRQGSHGFSDQLQAFLHRRLRLCTVVLGGAILAMTANAMITHLASGRYLEVGFLDFNRAAHLVGVLVAAGFLAVLSKKYLSRGWLLAIDAGMVWSLILGFAVFSHFTWKHGPTFVVPILGLFLLGRAVFVPCRAGRTFWLSAPAIPAILAVQLLHGEFYADTDLRHPDSSFGTLVAWNQLVLVISVGLAVVTSRVSFFLRRKVYEVTELGQYKLETKIGEGAMGEVYRARHAMMRRPTAVKVIRAAMVDDRTIARFEQEVRLTARLTHPNTISIYDYGLTAEGTFYYAMELLDGDDLREIVKASGPMPPARVIHILVQACAALNEAHAKDLVHRDVKAGNLILCNRGLQHDVVKVMDFGLVKDTSAEDFALTNVGEVCGTPETIAPETLRGKEAHPAVDVYALGAVGYYLLTGKPIFDAESVHIFMVKHVTEAPIPPSDRGVDVPEDLERVLLSCLAKKPEDRPLSADALSRALLVCEDAGMWSQEDASTWWCEWKQSRCS